MGFQIAISVGTVGSNCNTSNGLFEEQTNWDRLIINIEQAVAAGRSAVGVAGWPVQDERDEFGTGGRDDVL